jgi:hypothetical protein
MQCTLILAAVGNSDSDRACRRRDAHAMRIAHKKRPGAKPGLEKFFGQLRPTQSPSRGMAAVRRRWRRGTMRDADRSA